MVIYYDTKTGNVKRFVDAIKLMDSTIVAYNINDIIQEDEQGHLITFTTGAGFVPITTSYFMERNFDYILSVSSSGNKNFGRNFALASHIIAVQYNLPILLKFELSGTNEDRDFLLKQYFNKTI